jgi:hypothetical protein
VLWESDSDHTAADNNDPAAGTDWQANWLASLHEWAPQRVPEFLLQALLHGASAWLERWTGPVTATMLDDAMRDWLESAVLDINQTQKQRRKGRPLARL